MNSRNAVSQFVGVIRVYRDRLRAFQPNARLYLVNVIITGVAMGVYRLLFNFYVLSLGFDEAILGNLITTSSLTALLAALPMGYLADLLGRKRSLFISGSLIAIAMGVIVFYPSQGMLYAMNVVSGIAQSLAAVTMSPFLMENSQEQERTYLFSISMGLQMAMASVGNWIGGYLPTWFASLRGGSPTSSSSYAGALFIVSMALFLALIPIALLRESKGAMGTRTVFAPIAYARKKPVLLTKLILPMLLTSIGAGLIMPFMNVFFRQEYGLADPVIGAMFAWGSLAMGIGLLIAPPLADRMGKIQLVVITQGISIPFLILLGFSPIFWISALSYYVRLALMNMSSPVYETFVMEHVESSARATVASLASMAWNFGWAFSPTISGYLQVRYGFGPAFLGTIFLYTISVFLYWVFFWHAKGVPSPETAIVD